MTDKPLRPATRDDVTNALGYALRFNRSGKPHRMATGAAEVAEQVGNVDRTDAGEARQADATLAATCVARDMLAAEVVRA